MEMSMDESKGITMEAGAAISAIAFAYQTSVVTRRQFDEHLKLYQGYVEKSNEIAHKLCANAEQIAANATYSHYRGLKKGESYAIDGVILHELYFQNLVTAQANGASAPGRKTLQLLAKNWGGLEKWKADFTACGKAARGWAVCAYEQRTATCRNVLLDTHDEGHICAAFPLIVMDMYEHAYFLDYATDKAAYIGKFIGNIPWDVVEKRVGAVMR